MTAGGEGRPPGRPSILALDLSLTGTGYCLEGVPGVIRSKLSGYERLSEIRDTIARLTFGIDLVIVEDIVLGYTPGKKSDRIKLAGIIEMWLYDHRITTVLLNPSTLKKFATGKGNAQKINMASAAWHRFHLGDSHTDDNEIDAYLLWCAAREAYGGAVAKVPAPQAAVIHRLEWPKL